MQKRKRIPSNPYQNSFSRKKARVAASTNIIPRSLKAFPKSMRVKLKYNAIFDGSITAGATPTQYNWRANSVFDPDAAVGGGQPRGFTQWSNFYEKYHVVKSSCRLRLLDKDTGTSGANQTSTGLYGIAIRDGSAATTVRELTEDDSSKYDGYDSFNSHRSVYLTFDAAKHWGTNNLLDNDHLGGTTGAVLGSNPVDQAYFMTWANQAPSSGATAQPFLWDVMLEYDVIFTDPKDLA
jgi:hypothetical protein